MTKLLQALDGYKTVIGLVVMRLPDILDSLAAAIGLFVPFFNDLHMAVAAVAVTKFVGALVVVVGILHRAQKVTDLLK